MKRSSEENFVQDQTKRITSPLMSAQYLPQAQTQQSPPALSPYPFLPYPGNLIYTRPPQWPSRYDHPTNLPPPPIVPPPTQPPPPPVNSNLNQLPMPIFDLTQPPPPIRPNMKAIKPNSNCLSTSNMLPGISPGMSRIPNPCVIRPPLRGRGVNFRGLQVRSRSLLNLRNVTPNTVQQVNPNTNLEDPDGKRILVNRKSKRKPMSARYMRSKEWDRDDAEKALALENEFNKMQRTPMLILKFPDPDLNKQVVKKYSTAIDTVHFQQPSTPRYCFVTLKDGNDIEKVRKELCEIPFGTGKIVAEQKFPSNEENQSVLPEEIDPYTLYIGNLPTKVCVKTVKEHFPGAARIDIGYAQRMKYTRYAFIRYNNVEDAMEAYKRTYNTPIGNRSLIVRFRRSKGNIGLPGESRIPNAPKKLQEAIKGENNSKGTTTKIPKPSGDSATKTHSDEKDEQNVLFNSDEYEEEEEEDEDSKANFFDEARKIRLNMNQHLKHYHRSLPIKQEYNDYEDMLNSPEQNRNKNNSNHVSGNLLESRIKEEPMDDDELLACARTYNMDDDFNVDDDFDDEEPEEEDDFLDNQAEQNIFSDPPKFERTSMTPISSKSNETENSRLCNSFTEVDVKPDFSTLPPLPYTSSTYGFNSGKYQYTRNQTNNYGLRMNNFSRRKNEKTGKDNEKDDDDEDDIFDDLNADDDLDDIGDF
ncbi:uncharacterized protein LOC129610053 [Condylostylus longicornis]|uniref:uncharacterized protein LOC129610053 n=1 Tax=Condylostylus longicornis TaxID=2530218 RepID=UPI00244D9EF9|nr:uncharacterized protein LOC129610053 [Condylostylus longicornis]